MNTRKLVIEGIALVALALLVLPFALADSYQLTCLKAGETIDLPTLCNPAMEPRTGPINLCVHYLDNGKICPTSINVCNSLGLSCTSGTNTTHDLSFPNMTIFSPANNGVYTKKSVLLDLDPTEKSDVDFIDNNNERVGWKQVCNGCTRYSKERNFNEGPNNLTFRVRDQAGNTAFFDVFFYIDSKVPKIKSAEPKKGFASGDFRVLFQEGNPESLILKYGSLETGNREKELDIEDECVNTGTDNYECNTNVDLSDFDGEQISYNFALEDVAGNLKENPIQNLDVDYSSPIINNVTYRVEGKNVILVIDVTEPYLNSVTYLDNNEQNGKEKNLCKSLTGGLCQKKVSLKDGDHDLTIFVKDMGGNVVNDSIQFFTDSKDPKIKKTMPEKGLTSGLFYLEFQEENPENLTLTYGNLDDGFRSFDVMFNDINTCGNNGKGDWKCSIDIRSMVDDFNDQFISYFFTLEDKGEHLVNSKEKILKVDTEMPEIVNINSTVNGLSAEVSVLINETNVDEVIYMNLDDIKPTERKLCSKLINGICKGKVKLNSGSNTINVQVVDLAGNSVSENTEILA